MKRFWIIVSVVCVIIAGVSLWFQRTNVAFVAGTLGAVAWFLNYRAGLKALLPQPDPSNDEELNETDET